MLFFSSPSIYFMKNYKRVFFFLLVSLLTACNSSNVTTNDTTTTSSSSVEEIKTGVSNKSSISGSLLNEQDDPLVKWEGRNEFKIGDRETPARMYLYHTATGFSIDFYGTSLEVDFYHSGLNDIYYEYAIDDEVIPTNNRRFYLPKGQEKYTALLAEDLSEGHHTIKCLKASEPRDGITAIEEFRTDGHFYYRRGIDQEKLKFMCVNASSGSGYGVLAYSEGSSKISRTTKNSSSLHSYMYMTARRFDADVHYVASAGWGIAFPSKYSIPAVFDYTGITTSNNVEGAKTTALWDHSSYVPDVILMHLGGNDTDEKDFDLVTYQETLVNFVDKLHKLYPLAKIIWLHTNTNSGGYGMTALEEFGAVRKGYVKEVIFPKVGKGETGDNTYGAASHHSFKSHLDASKIMTEFISDTYGYEVKRDALTFEQFESIIEKK